MSEHIKKRHNKSLLLYHVVCPIRCRVEILGPKERQESLRKICEEISKRYEIHFVEIGMDIDHVHFFIQSVPTMAVNKMVGTIKSLIGREMFKRHPEIKKALWGGEFWTKGYYVNTVGQYGNAEMIGRYVKNQGKEYEKLHEGELTLFEGLV